MWAEILTIGWITTFLSAAVRMGIPLACASLGETVSQRAGTLNIGLEANMLSGAFFGFVVTYRTGSLPLGFLAGMLGGALFSMIHAFFAVYLRQNQNVAGTALNMFALGFTSYLFQVLVNNADGEYPQIVTLQSLPIPGLSKIPVIGEAFFNKDVVAYTVYILVILLAVFFKKTMWGMSLTSIGENPQAADTVGLPVFRIKYAAALFNGLMGGLGGAYLILAQLGMFSENVTSGRGYIALSLVVFGRRNPVGVFFASLFMGGANALQFKLQAMGVALPVQVFTGLPYVLTVLVLLFSAVKKNNSDPAALGKPYVRSMR
ncbi:ABC transporter permease [Ruminococcaceae bacterium OttesenSCG-928-A11]|nr:ABC transporter permease [Ruminococcaceae bacterium OttesenSCG-928-A11]